MTDDASELHTTLCPGCNGDYIAEDGSEYCATCQSGTVTQRSDCGQRPPRPPKKHVFKSDKLDTLMGTMEWSCRCGHREVSQTDYMIEDYNAHVRADCAAAFPRDTKADKVNRTGVYAEPEKCEGILAIGPIVRDDDLPDNQPDFCTGYTTPNGCHDATNYGKGCPCAIAYHARIAERERIVAIIKNVVPHDDYCSMDDCTGCQIIDELLSAINLQGEKSN